MCPQSGFMDNIDFPLVIRVALLVAAEISQITTCGENSSYTWGGPQSCRHLLKPSSVSIIKVNTRLSLIVLR